MIMKYPLVLGFCRKPFVTEQNHPCPEKPSYGAASRPRPTLSSEEPTLFALIRAAAERAQLRVVPDGCFSELVRKGSDLRDMRGECLDEDYALAL